MNEMSKNFGAGNFFIGIMIIAFAVFILYMGFRFGVWLKNQSNLFHLWPAVRTYRSIYTFFVRRWFMDITSTDKMIRRQIFLGKRRTQKPIV